MGVLGKEQEWWHALALVKDRLMVHILGSWLFLAVTTGETDVGGRRACPPVGAGLWAKALL